MSLRIIDLQRRLREIGRIRIGEKVTAQNGKVRPAKLDVFRFTSRDEQVIRAAADAWGGAAEPWPDGPGGGQWQVRTTAQQIPVVVPPGDMSFSQAYEQWTAGGCKVRCDSRWDHVGDKACHCDPEDRACSIHTRLSVMVPDLPGIGVWRLESHGYYAAVELGGIVDICAAQSARGVMLPARLRLEHREVKRQVDGRVQTRKFVVPVLDLDVHPLALTAGVNPATGEIGGGQAVGELQAPRPALTPVPPQPAALAPSVAEQVAAVDDPPPRQRRANAAQPMPSTGLRPRTAAQAAAEQDAAGGQPGVAGPAGSQEAGADAAGSEMVSPGDATPGGTASPPAYNAGDVGKRASTVFAADYQAAPRGKKTAVVDRLRHAVVWAATKERTASARECEPAELARAMSALDDIAAGRMTYKADPLDDQAGVTFRLSSGREVPVLWAAFERPVEDKDGAT